MRKDVVYQCCFLCYIAGFVTRELIVRLKATHVKSCGTNTTLQATSSLASLSVKELRALGRDLKVSNYYTIKKTNLIDAIEEARQSQLKA